MSDTKADREKMLAEAQRWLGTPYKMGGEDKDGIDCSHFVKIVLMQVDPWIEYMTADDLRTSSKFCHAAEPKPGDIVSWPGHCAIVINPDTGEFIGAQTTNGVSKSSYKTNPYWRDRPNRMFIRPLDD